jgi:hypothetical protein
VSGMSVRDTKNYAWWILVCDIKVVRASYWRDREVMHNPFKVCEA